MRKMLIGAGVVVAMLVGGAALEADQAAWIVTGRTAQASVEWVSFDGLPCSCVYDGGFSTCTVTRPGCDKVGVTLAAQVLIEDISPLSQLMGGPCRHDITSDAWPLCEHLALVLGQCTKQMVEVSFTDFSGATRTFHHYECVAPGEAPCITMSGHLTPDLRVESVFKSGFCYPMPL